MSDFEQVLQAKTLHRAALLKHANVVGVGVGYKTSRGREGGELSVVVLVRRKLPAAALSDAALLPKDVGGFRTDVIEVGELRAADRLPRSSAQAAAQEYTSRMRPAPGGVSIGHYHITAGTLGSVVYDRRTRRRLILSNNHVLANSNAGLPGDPILQPGPADGGQPGADTIAVLERFIRLRFTNEPAQCNIAGTYAWVGNQLARLSGSRHRLQAYQQNPGAVNRMDAALARPLDEDDLLDNHLGYGAVCGRAEAQLGQAVCKSGRTTAFTNGQVQVLEASVVVGYTGDRTAAFEGQVVTTPMSQGGDSGSLIVTAEGHQAVGLLFAGSPQSTIFTPIQPVLDAMKVDLPGERTNGLAHGLTGSQDAAQRARAARQAHEAQLLARANVVGVGVGLRYTGGRPTGEVGLVVLVTQKLPAAQLAPGDLLPDELDGVPVDVREVGAVSTE
ncbi:MAG: hypothetical protein ACKOC5_03630 [Chloroflexota bacterium]